MTYSRSQIAYHWLTFALLLVMAGTGLAYSYDLAGDGALNAHQIAGQLLIVTLVFRIVARLTRPAPLPHPGHKLWERRLAGLVHVGLYLCLIAFVVTGYVSASALSDTVLLAPLDRVWARSDTGEVFLIVHFALKWVLLGLVALHLGGALKHALIDRDTTLNRMLSPSK